MSYHHKSGAQKRREKAMRAEVVKGQNTLKQHGFAGVDTMGGDRCQNSRPYSMIGGGGGGGGGVVKCCRLLHKTITTSIDSSLYSIPLAIIFPESVSPNHMMAAAARGSVINALVPTQDGRSVSSDQMDAFIPTIELAYREFY